jgi:hypothetical protein
MYNLANFCRDAGRLDQAIALWEETLKGKSRLWPDHPLILMTMNNLALAYTDVGEG